MALINHKTEQSPQIQTKAGTVTNTTANPPSGRQTKRLFYPTKQICLTQIYPATSYSFLPGEGSESDSRRSLAYQQEDSRFPSLHRTGIHSRWLCVFDGRNGHVITAYHDHGHALSVGRNGRMHGGTLWEGYWLFKGKGGSMHYFDPAKHYWGGHGIVEGNPLGRPRYALKYKKIEGCAICFLGDGAINQGAFHESLNLAALWDLPVVYIVENNGYSMGTSQERSSAHPDAGIAARAEGYKMHWAHINGESIFDIREGVSAAMELAKSGRNLPCLKSTPIGIKPLNRQMRTTRNTAPKRKSRTIGRTTTHGSVPELLDRSETTRREFHQGNRPSR